MCVGVGDCEGYFAALKNWTKYFFAQNFFNYARLMPFHLAQINSLERDDQVIRKTLQAGEFVVSKSDALFTSLFTDQA